MLQEKGRRRKRRRTIAREGVGEGEREGEREGDMLRGLSPHTKNAGYVPECTLWFHRLCYFVAVFPSVGCTHKA